MGGPTTTFTGSTTLGTTKELSGSLKVTVGSMAECNSMADANGVAALKEMLKTETGGIATTNMVVTVTCARRRRLSDGRRLRLRLQQSTTRSQCQRTRPSQQVQHR